VIIIHGYVHADNQREVREAYNREHAGNGSTFHIYQIHTKAAPDKLSFLGYKKGTAKES
jgi:hypothetical protein